MGLCMAPEVRKELKQIRDIYDKTCELKEFKRVLVVGGHNCGKSELIEQAISTKKAKSINLLCDKGDLEFQYPMGPFVVNEKAPAEHSLQEWKYKNDIISWDNTLSYYPPTSQPASHYYEDSSSCSSFDSYSQDLFDFDLLITGFSRGSHGISFDLKIRELLHSYYPQPEIQCKKDEIIGENMVEFWELSAFDEAFWTFCVKQIVAIAFVVDVSCFDEFDYDPLTYTKTKNKMSETMEKFRQMIQHKAVKECNNIAFFVIFNKIDVFKQKLSRGTSIKTCPELRGYAGDDYDYKQCITYIQNIFDVINDNSDGLVYFHETSAVQKNGSDQNSLSTIHEDSSSDNVKKVWHKFGANLNYHWDLLHNE